MVSIKKKHLYLFILLNIMIIFIISLGINYAYSKIYWSNRVSIHSGINAEDFEGTGTADTLTTAYIGQAYKIGTAFEVYKPKDPLLKVVSKNHGALEMAVASGRNHFSDLAKPRDAIIRKVGEGNLILSIPSYTRENVRSIIIGNESKPFMEFKNSDTLLINTGNISLNADGELRVRDIKLNQLTGGMTLSAYLVKLKASIHEQSERIEALEKTRR